MNYRDYEHSDLEKTLCSADYGSQVGRELILFGQSFAEEVDPLSPTSDLDAQEAHEVLQRLSEDEIETRVLQAFESMCMELIREFGASSIVHIANVAAEQVADQGE